LAVGASVFEIEVCSVIYDYLLDIQEITLTVADEYGGAD
jgi:hypothetical protein